MRNVFLYLLIFVTVSYAEAQSKPARKYKRNVYEEINFEDLMKRYFAKERVDFVEGIYSVSCVITKRNKVFLSKRERIRIVERKDNYARVAILKDWPATGRDYVEISLSFQDTKKYPVVGELNTLADGEGFIYKHIEPDRAPISFSMISESAELLEGEYSEMQRRNTITYRLSYLKIYPQNIDLTASKVH